MLSRSRVMRSHISIDWAFNYTIFHVKEMVTDESDPYENQPRLLPYSIVMEQIAEHVDDYLLANKNFFDSKNHRDLSFRKGDIVRMIQKNTKRKGWIFAEHCYTLQQGFAHETLFVNYEVEISPDWYAGLMPREEAEDLLSNPDLPIGAFLIRQRLRFLREYTLSVRVEIGNRPLAVNHYKIRKIGGKFRFTSKAIFDSLKKLVDSFVTTPGGYFLQPHHPLPCRLTMPALRQQHQQRHSFDVQKIIQGWQIPRDELEIQAKIGSGAFGAVHYGKWKGEIDVAVKAINSDRIDHFLWEASVMKTYDHRNVIKLYGVSMVEEPRLIVMEFMEGCNLRDHLRKSGMNLDMGNIIAICAQIADGMFYLERRQVVHRDLAARNILICERNSAPPIVKVADFGLAKWSHHELGVVVETDGVKNGRWPWKWLAPEAITRDTFSTKSDVWSFAIVINEIFDRGEQPYNGMSNKKAVEAILAGYRMPRPVDCPNWLYQSIMLSCWDADPHQRPSFRYLYYFFTEIVNQRSNPRNNQTCPDRLHSLGDLQSLQDHDQGQCQAIKRLWKIVKFPFRKLSSAISSLFNSNRSS